jgi:hypothetical protein
MARLTASVMPVTSSKAKPMKQFSLVAFPPDSLLRLAVSQVSTAFVIPTC